MRQFEIDCNKVCGSLEIDCNKVSGSLKLTAITPKAFAKFSPGFELTRTLGSVHIKRSNPERVRQPSNPFRVENGFFKANPGLSLRSNPGLKLANAFGVLSKFQTETLPNRSSPTVEPFQGWKWILQS
jgi:hypothetical protein